MNDEGLWFQAVEGFCFRTDKQTNKQTDICDCRVAFAIENLNFCFLTNAQFSSLKKKSVRKKEKSLKLVFFFPAMFPSNSFSSSQQQVQRLNSRISCFHLHNSARVNSNCYIIYQDNSQRILQSPHGIMKDSSMTIEKFEKFCFEKNYLYECFYLNIINPKILKPKTVCNKSCTGDSSQICECSWCSPPFFLQKVHKEQLILWRWRKNVFEGLPDIQDIWNWKCDQESKEIIRAERSWEWRCHESLEMISQYHEFG